MYQEISLSRSASRRKGELFILLRGSLLNFQSRQTSSRIFFYTQRIERRAEKLKNVRKLGSE